VSGTAAQLARAVTFHDVKLGAEAGNFQLGESVADYDVARGRGFHRGAGFHSVWNWAFEITGGLGLAEARAEIVTGADKQKSGARRNQQEREQGLNSGAHGAGRSEPRPGGRGPDDGQISYDRLRSA
jgi:hypothetical protein